jgi:glycosyltransferase involved in cell wall biosynthesis
MIVKNEAHVIQRCLDSVKQHVDGAVIVDTGSTDGTQDLIAQSMPEAIVIDRPWVDFGYNRTEALALAKQHPADYILLIDADEELRAASPFGPLTADLYGAWHQVGDRVRYPRPLLLRADRSWYWQGVLHEELLCRNVGLTSKLLAAEQARVVDHFDSSRNRRPDKYLRDAELLAQQPRTPRNVFYLAQSYRDAGHYDLALDYYMVRCTMTGAAEETWYATYQVARLKEVLGRQLPEVREAYMRAYNARPTRAEPLYHLTRYLQRGGCTRDADKVLQLWRSVPDTYDTMRVEVDAYVSQSSQRR